MEHKNIETMDEWTKSRLKAVLRNRESEKQNNAGCVTVKELDPMGEKFAFQCSCGVKHQFSYTVNEVAARLEVMLCDNKTAQVTHALGEECLNVEQHYKPERTLACESPNAELRGRPLAASPATGGSEVERRVGGAVPPAPTFELHGPDGKVWMLYEDGTSTGFPEGTVIVNRARPQLDLLRGRIKEFEAALIADQQ